MLVLKRRLGERIFVDLESGERITIEVTGVSGDSVRLGIVAPRHVSINREEIAPPLSQLLKPSDN